LNVIGSHGAVTQDLVHPEDSAANQRWPPSDALAVNYAARHRTTSRSPASHEAYPDEDTRDQR
jgi:hypothetical protein